MSTFEISCRNDEAPFGPPAPTGLGWPEFFQRLGDGTLSPLHREPSSNFVPA
jgi:hypothetical protein